MKHCLIILTVFCALFNSVYAQSKYAGIDSLIKFGVITQNQRPIIEKEFKYYRDNASDRVVILSGLDAIMDQKIYHINPHTTGLFVSYEGHLNKKSQDSLNTSLRIVLDKLNRAGLLTARVYSHAKTYLNSNEYQAEVQMIGDLGSMSSRFEALAPDRLMPVADQLHNSGIVSDTSFVRLENDIKNSRIESSFQLNDYCKLDRTFDLSKYPDDPSLWLEQFHRDVASILPNLNFTNFSFTALPDSSSVIKSMPQTKFKVSLTCNGQVYKYTSVTFDYKTRQGKKHFTDALFFETCYRIFNKILTDQDSPYRLFNIYLTHGSARDEEYHHLSLIALREEQTDIFLHKPCLSYMLIPFEQFDNTLTSGRIDSIITGWKKMRLFAHLSEAEISKSVDDARADKWYSTNDLLNNFPNVIYPLYPSIIVSKHPYVDLLSHLGKITHGAFNPTRVTEKKIGNEIKLKYLSNGKIHFYTFNIPIGWFEPKFDIFLDNLKQENKLPGDFYLLPDDYFIYLTKQQYAYAKEHKLLDFEIVPLKHKK